MKKKVLILANTFYPILGGVETHLLDLIKELSKEKHLEIHIIAYGYYGVENNPYLSLYKNVKVNLLNICSDNPKEISNWLQLHSNLYYFSFTIVPLFIYTFFYCLRNKEFDVIHAQSQTTGIVAYLISKIFGIKKKIISMHGIMFGKSKYFRKYAKFRLRIKILFNRFDKVFCIGKRSYNEIAQLMGGSKKLELFRYWVDERFFVQDKNQEKVKKELILPKGKIVFYAGRLLETKGIMLLLKVAAKTPEYFFIIAGGGILEDKVREYSKMYKNIIFIGKVENSLLPKYYQAAHVSILLSTGFTEGLPRFLLESIACGTPVLVTARGGAREIADFGVGLIVTHSILDIRNKMRLFMENESYYKEKQNKCQLIAKKYFSKENAQLFVRNYLN